MIEYIMDALPIVGEATLSITRSSLSELRNAAKYGAVSLVGHESTARILGVRLSREALPSFRPDDVFYVAGCKEDVVDVYRVKVLNPPAISTTVYNRVVWNGGDKRAATQAAETVLQELEYDY